MALKMKAMMIATQVPARTTFPAITTPLELELGDPGQ